jgi:hypothetical protein
MMRIACGGLRYIGSLQMREDMSENRTPYVASWTALYIIFQQGGKLWIEKDGFVLAFVLCRPRKQGLSCPSVNSALVVDQGVL